jgi:hypothetical protein
LCDTLGAETPRSEIDRTFCQVARNLFLDIADCLGGRRVVDAGKVGGEINKDVCLNPQR